MKINFKISLIIFSLLTFILLIINSCKKEKEDSKKIVTTSYSKVNKLEVDLPVYPNGWIAHNANTPNPNEGSTSPFAKSTTTNGIFHQWSWQKFLWLTKPSSTTNRLPLFLNQDSIIQVDSYMQKFSNQSSATVILKAFNQAGSPEGVLQINPNYNANNKVADTVFYSLHVNPLFYKTAVNFKDKILNGTLPVDNSETFPVGSLEIKASWVDVNTISSANLSNFYTTTAAISSDNGVTYTNKNVALLGIHVVGVVENHPEFIWATFEHNDLAPSYNWHSNNASTSTEKLLFSTGSTTGLDGITYNNGVKVTDKAFDLFKYGVPVDSTGFMKNTSQDGKTNFNNMASINFNAATNLTDVWKNYFYNGSIWIDTDGMTPAEQAAKIISLGYSIGSATKGSSARGSLNNANVTMETFTQTFQSDISKVNVATLANCFSCHSANSFKQDPINKKYDISPIYISHVFDAYLQKAQGNSIKEVEVMKASQEKHIEKRKN